MATKKCANCGCPKGQHEHSLDAGRNGGQCRKHHQTCHYFADPEARDALKKMLVEETTWEIRWRAKVDGKPWKSGKDIIVVKDPDFDKYRAGDLLEYFAEGYMPDDEHPDMPNFNAYYPYADVCENWELVSAKKVGKK